jgi:hypothetical protein
MGARRLRCVNAAGLLIGHWALGIAHFGMDLAQLRSLQVDPLLDDCEGALSNHYGPAANQCPMSNAQ